MTPNGCTWWPDGLFGVSWVHCCDAHDIAYLYGLPRDAADEALIACVTAATGSPLLASVMGLGVALFGWLFYNRAKKTPENDN